MASNNVNKFIQNLKKNRKNLFIKNVKNCYKFYIK